MALQQDTVSIDLAQGVNNKVDDKIAGPEQNSILVNATFDKDKRLQKRNGLTAQSTNFEGHPSFINPVAFADNDLKSKVFAHEDQLCLINNGNLFSQFKGQDKWIFKGSYVPLSLNLSRLDANVNFIDTVTVGSVTVAVGGAEVYVVEESTGNIIKHTTMEVGFRALKLIGFSNSAYVLVGSSSYLYARPVSLSTGVVGTASELSSSTLYPNYPYLPGVATTSSASAIGEAAFLLFYSTSSSSMILYPFKPSGTTLPTRVVASISHTEASSIMISPADNPNRIYVDGSYSELGIAQAYTFGSTSYTVNYSTGLSQAVDFDFVNSRSHGVTASLSPINGQDLFIFYDRISNSNITSEYSDDAVVIAYQISSSGGSLDVSLYGQGYLIGGNSFVDKTRKTIYLPCIYKSPLQTTWFLMDALEGKSDFTTYVQAKCLYGNAYAEGVSSASLFFSLPQSYPTTPDGDVFRTLNNGYFIDIDLTPENGPQVQYLANTTHGTGGLLWAYDGQSLSEHNFLISPEQINVYASSISLFTATTQEGSVGQPEIFTVTFGPGSFIRYGDGGTNYWAFTSTTSGNYYVWYTVDGIGSDPAPAGRTGIRVDISSTATANEVAAETAEDLNKYDISFGLSGSVSISANVITFTADVNGDVPNASVSGMNRVGPLTSGSYQWTTVWSWRDRNGQVYRSAPAVPFTLTVSGSASADVSFWTPLITNKEITDISTEIYRTLANGTTFYFIGSTSWSPSTTRFQFIDDNSDGSIDQNRILYTDGSILENYNIGACKSVYQFKERLQVTGLADDTYAVYYSKTILHGEPVNFTAETFYRVDADLTPITAVAQMDDKSVVFKPNLVYVLSGDGANDLGQGSTFSPPMLVASDTGASSPSSIVTYPNGLIYKSQKGIYNLNRSLGVEYIGANVQDFNDFDVTGGVMKSKKTEIVFTLSGTSTGLVYNYYFGRWDLFSNYESDSICIWDNKIAITRSSGKVLVENDKFYDVDQGSQSYSMSLASSWLKLKGIQDFQRVYSIMFLGKYLSPHTVNVNVSYDYDETTEHSNDYEFNATELIGNPSSYPGGSVYQFQVNLERQKCDAIKIKFTEHPGEGSQESLYLNNMSAVVGLKKGLNKIPPDKNI